MSQCWTVCDYMPGDSTSGDAGKSSWRALPKLALRDKGGIESRLDKGLRPRCVETRTESL